jgi:ParB family chromosome partitioning protein
VILLTDKIQNISLSKIQPNPYQPRKDFDGDENKIEELAESLKSAGLLQPIMVRPHNRNYQIAMGERRLRAAKKAGLKEIPAIVRKMDDKSLRLYSIIENVHRLGLRPQETEDAYYGLWKKHYEPDGHSKADMAREMGLPASAVTDKIFGYESRKGFGLNRGYDEKISTHDLRAVRGLEPDIAKKMLVAKAEETIDSRDLDKYAPILKEAPEDKREEIMEGLLESKSHIEEYEADVGELARDTAENEPDTVVRIDKSVDQKRLEKFTDLWNEVRWWGPEKVRLIEDLKLRKKAIDTLDDIGQHLIKLAQRMRKEEGQNKD